MSQLPFPTVTICPKLPFDRFAAISALLDQVHSHKGGDALIHIFLQIEFPCRSFDERCPGKEYIRERFGSVMDKFREDILELLEQLSNEFFLIRQNTIIAFSFGHVVQENCQWWSGGHSRDALKNGVFPGGESG